MIPANWASVDSSNVKAVKYDAAAGELHVQFHNGKTYAYEGVPPEEAENLFHASSPGSYLRNNIIGSYNDRRI